MPVAATAARIGRAAVTVALTLLLAAAAGAAVAAALTGVRVVVVASGSMEPALRTGDALVVRPTGAAGVAPADIVVYRNGGHRWVIHRVMEIRVVNGQRYLVTKGDANNTTDPDLTPTDAVYGQATLRVPFLGRVVHFLTTPTARLLLAAAILLVIVHELLVIARIRRGMRARA
jgi:signal peptidase